MKNGHPSTQHNFQIIVAIILLIPMMFFEAMRSMIDVWIINETFTHGFLIFPISLWLLWKKRDQLQALETKPEPRLIIVILPILLLWFISHTVDIQIIQQLCMMSLIPAFIWLILGRKVLSFILFPLFFLYFAIPLGQGLIPPMMELTANFVVYLVKLFGIPIYQEGLYFLMPTGSWNVVEECSGVRYLIASVALGTIYAYISYESNLKRIVFIIFAILIPILANGLRAFGIVMIGHFSGMKLATGVDHLVYGWLFFGIVIFLMFYIGSYWWDPVGSKNATLKNMPQKLQLADSNKIKIFAFASIVCILLIKLFAYKVTHKQIDIPDNLQLSLPENLLDWQLDPRHSANWAPELSSPDAILTSTYRSGNDSVQLDIGYYAYQRQNAEAVTSLNRLTDPYEGQWKISFSSEFEESDVQVREVEIRKSNNKILIWQWYRMGQIQTAKPYMAKFYEAYNQIITINNHAAYISLSTTLDENKEISRNRLRNFLIASSQEIGFQIDSLKR